MGFDRTFDILEARATPVLREMDDLFEQRIPDANRVASNSVYRSDVDAVALAAWVDGRLVGGLVGHGPTPQLGRSGLRIDAVTRRVRCIAQIAVANDFVQQGLGRALVSHAEARFRTSGSLVVVFVDDHSDRSAAHFWRNLGYRSTGHVCKGMSTSSVLPPQAGLYAQVGSSRSGTFFVKSLT